ncbi:MAG: hypothetical protein PUG67_01495 [Peptoniphilaceae bacterium]|nr:hypothetical protein [Peptoniphilaceae bacterium]MDY6018437.1 hypothetical protein [Anaerococcus sp.]
MKNKGLLVYIIAFFFTGVLCVLSTSFAFQNKAVDFAYPILFIIILVILGRIIKRYKEIMN